MRRVFILLAVLGLAASASAQTPASQPWDRCTTIQVFGGAATAPPNTAGTFGGAVGWQLTHQTEIEGTATWLSQRRGAEAFAADLKLMVNLTPPARVVPYLGGGAGMYRATFDTTRADMPQFYRRRLDGTTPLSRLSYTDPTAVIAGGAQIYFARHFSIRPEATLRFVVDEGDTYRMGTVTFAVVYHIEDHVSANRR